MKFIKHPIKLKIMYLKLSILVLFLFFSCKKVDKKYQFISLDKTSEVSILDFFDTVKVIQLETSDECLISDIFSIEMYNNKIFVFDIKSQMVFCFNTEGEFIYKITKKGRGPDEYSYLGSIGIDIYNKYLLLLEPFGVLHRYDFLGNFISKVQLPYEGGAYNEVYAINKDSLVFQSLNKYHILFYSTSQNKIYNTLFKIEKLYGFTSLFRTYYYNDSVHFSTIYSNEVLNLSDKDQKIVYNWNFGKANNSKIDIENARKYFAYTYNDHEKYNRAFTEVVGLYLKSYMYDQHETSRYRIACVRYKDQFLNVIIDKFKNTTKVFTATRENITYYGGWCRENKLLLCPDRIWYGYKEGGNKNICNADLLTKKEAEIVHNYNPEIDNPYLVIYTFKQ